MRIDPVKRMMFCQLQHVSTEHLADVQKTRKVDFAGSDMRGLSAVFILSLLACREAERIISVQVDVRRGPSFPSVADVSGH